MSVADMLYAEINRHKRIDDSVPYYLTLTYDQWVELQTEMRASAFEPLPERVTHFLGVLLRVTD